MSQTTGNHMSGPTCCPICAHTHSVALLDLPGFPVYQHPVPADAEVPKPWFVDLHYQQCTHCHHAWQPEFDADMLARVYESYYYTPSPEGVGVQFRDDFLLAMKSFGLLAISGRSLLEIGASAGDTLAKLHAEMESPQTLAFEPNHDNAAQARLRGLNVRETFFGAASAQGLPAFDLIYARHVIEHIFDFNDVLQAFNSVAHADSDLVLETPCLDWHVEKGSTAPFHVEHNHVFSIASLAHLAARAGWGCQQYTVTDAGNMIMWFRRRGQACVLPASVKTADLQARVVKRASAVRARLAGRKLLFWGAGSASCNLMGLLGREPDYLVDGNAGKVGKVFVGRSCRVADAESTLQHLMALPETQWPLVVIASSFDREIRLRLSALGWQGEIVSLHGEQAIELN